MFHQYIPCVEFDEKGEFEPHAINAEEWGHFLCELYEQWYPNDAYNVSIRYFDAILGKMVDGASAVCTMADNCCQYFVVEYNVDVYPCDFFVEARYKLGNIMEDSREKLLHLSDYQNFGSQKKEWHPQCSTCEVLSLCAGDCLKHRVSTEFDAKNLSRLCEGWKRFYEYTQEGFAKLSDSIKEQRALEQSQFQNPQSYNRSNPGKIGRNDPCRCGSGKKFKKCCGLKGSV